MHVIVLCLIEDLKHRNQSTKGHFNDWL